MGKIKNFFKKINKTVLALVIVIVLSGILVGGIFKMKQSGGQVQGALTEASPIDTTVPTDTPTDTPTEAPTDTPISAPLDASSEGANPTDAPTDTPTPSATPIPTATPQNCSLVNDTTNAPDSGNSKISGGDGEATQTFTFIINDSGNVAVQGANVSPSATNVTFSPTSGTTDGCGNVTFSATASSTGTYSVNLSVTLNNGSSSSITPSQTINFNSAVTPIPTATPTSTPSPTPTP